MPNWCYQNMTVYAKTEQELTEFLGAIKVTKPDSDEELSLNQLYPTPQELVDTPSAFYADAEKQAEHAKIEQANIAKYGAKDWYDWNCSHWSTKWGACRVELISEPYKVINGYTLDLNFESAWGPSSLLIRKISELYPKMVFTISYTEESDAFVGVECFHNGELLREYNEEPELDELPDYEEDEDAYYEAYDKQRSEIMNKLSDMEDDIAREIWVLLGQ
jgi:hypothetical protein